MALVQLLSPIQWPGIVGYRDGNSLSSGGDGLRDAAGEYSAYIMQAVEDMAVTHVALKCSAVSGSPTGEIRFEDVDASGLPSGSLLAANNNVITGTLTTTVGVHALGATANISRGQIFALMVKYDSGTSFQNQVTARLGNGAPSLPYKVLNTGTPTKAGMTAMPCLAIGSGATTFYRHPSLLMVNSVGGGTFNNTSGARRGLRFTAPFDCRVVGIRHYPSNSVGNYNAIFMDDAGSELSSSSTAFDGDHNAASQFYGSDVFFDSPVVIAAGTTYRAVIEPSSATNVNFQTLVLPSTDYRAASPLGTFGHYTAYASAAWDDSATATLPYMDLLIDQIDDGAGGGGSGGEAFAAYVA
jgi:hypothetical protein